LNLFEGLERNSRYKPNKPAIIFNESMYSYKEYNEQVNRIANALINFGVKKGDKIALMMKNSDLFCFIYYGILKAGAVAVPINFRLTAKEAGYILDDSDSIIVFADDNLADIVQKAVEGNAKIQLQVITGIHKKEKQFLLSEFQSSILDNPQMIVLESDDAEIMYTSGTTGQPKGVVLDHHRVLHVALGTIITFKMGPEDQLLHIAPLFHCAQLNLFLVPGSYLGCTQIVRQEFNPVQTLKDIEHYKIICYERLL